LVKFNDKKRSGKLNFEFVVDFVDRLQLLECVIGEAKHVVLLIKFPYQLSWFIFLLIRYYLIVPFNFEMVVNGNMCVLVKLCTTFNELLEVFHLLLLNLIMMSIS